MYVNVMVGSIICDTSTIYKIQENTNFTNRTLVHKLNFHK